ncbi:MAG: cytochrome c3 family protein [Pseudomonadota bacterium]
MNARTRNRIILIIGCVATLLSLGGYVFPKKASDLVPPRIYFNTAGGPVLFTHQVHTDPSQFKCGNPISISKMECADCHHELVKANQVLSCKKCHPDEDYSKDSMKHPELVKMHPPRCTMCHNVRKGEIKPCRDCHLQTGESASVSCDKCHPNQKYSANDLTHEELEEIKGHWCTECHSTRRKVDAIHMQCDRCHAKLECGTYTNKKRYSDAEAFRCALCHLKSH